MKLIWLNKLQFKMYSTCDKIIEGLYLGNFAAATNNSILIRHGITHIIVAAFGLPQTFRN